MPIWLKDDNEAAKGWISISKLSSADTCPGMGLEITIFSRRECKKVAACLVTTVGAKYLGH